MTCLSAGPVFGYTLWNVPAVVIKEMRMGNELRRTVERTGGKEDDAGDVDVKLVLDNLLEKPAVDVERLSDVDCSVGPSFLGSILVFETPVPFEFL